MPVKLGKPKDLPWVVSAYDTATLGWVVKKVRLKKTAMHWAEHFSQNKDLKSISYGWSTDTTWTS